MRIAWVILLAAIVSWPSAASARPYDIATIYARHEQLAGQRVSVRGWLHACYRLSCGIAGEGRTDANFLSFGPSTRFDHSLPPHPREDIEIVVSGVVEPGCFPHPEGDPNHHDDVIIVCADRYSHLADPILLKVLRRRPTKEPN